MLALVNTGTCCQKRRKVERPSGMPSIRTQVCGVLIRLFLLNCERPLASKRWSSSSRMVHFGVSLALTIIIVLLALLLLGSYFLNGRFLTRKHGRSLVL